MKAEKMKDARGEVFVLSYGRFVAVGRSDVSRFRACLIYARERGEAPASLPRPGFVRYGRTPADCDFDGSECYYETKKPGRGAISVWLWT